MKRLLLFYFSLFVCFSLSAFEGDKDVMKMLKKEHKLKMVVETTEKDGYEYYLLVHKKGNTIMYGIADKSGKIIVPVRYNEIDYHEALEEGIQTSEEGKSFWGVGAKAVFLAKYRQYYSEVYNSEFDEVTFYDLSGKIVSGPYSKVKPDFWLPNSYGNYYIKMEDNNETVKKNLWSTSRNALFTSDGKMLFSFEYSMFYVYDEYIECEQHVNDVKRVGALLVDEDLKRQYGDTIPCVYADILCFHDLFRDTCIMQVKTNETEPYVDYDPNSVFDGSFKDDGEKYYSQRKWDKVLEFYSTEGVDTPWAQYFSGSAFRHKAYEWMEKGNTALYFVENAEESVINYHFKTTEFNFDNAIEFAIKAKTLLELYIANSDDKHKVEDARVQCSIIDDMLNKDIPENIQAYNKAIKILSERDEAKLRAALEAEQAARERSAAFWGAVLQGFVNGVNNAISSNSITAPTTSTSTNYMTGSSAGSSLSSPSPSSSSSDSGDAVGKARAQTRIRELKSQIHTYEGLLRDAEASETKCRAEKSNFLGQAIRDVNNYKNKLNSLNGEMNELKSKYGL